MQLQAEIWICLNAEQNELGSCEENGKKKSWFDNLKKENYLVHKRVVGKIILKLLLYNLLIADLTRLSETRDRMAEDLAVRIYLNWF
jgi:hypothetical protein